MEITKRNGTTESYNKEKIAVAIKKSFISTGKEVADEVIYNMVDEVEAFVNSDGANCKVEKIQDEVERILMEKGFYAEAKNYILYRWQRTERRKAVVAIIERLGDEGIATVLRDIQHDFKVEEYSVIRLAEKFAGFCKSDMKASEKLAALIKAAVELTTQEAPDWEFIAARLLN